MSAADTAATPAASPSQDTEYGDAAFLRTKHRDTRWLFLCPTVLLGVLMIVWAVDPTVLFTLPSATGDATLPPSAECLQEVHFMIIALCAGGLGAYLRVITNLPATSLHEFFANGNDLLSERLLVTAGMVIGVAVYWLINSKAFVHIAYSNAPDLGATTRTGVAIAAILAGLLTKELIGRVTSGLFTNRTAAAQPATPGTTTPPSPNDAAPDAPKA